MDDCQYITSNDKTLLDKIGTREPPTRSQRSMADEARLASALTGVTERLDAHDDAHEADDDGVRICCIGNEASGALKRAPGAEPTRAVKRESEECGLLLTKA